MRYHELIEDQDNDMFGSSERVDRDLRRVLFSENSQLSVPQPGPISGAPKKFGSDAKIQTRQMTANDIISSVPGVPYYNNVVDDWDAKDYSWGVTKKVIEYATYLKDHPESLAQLPPAIVLNGKFEDGAHRVSALWLLQQRMDPKNPLWKRAKLNVQFVEQGVAEGLDDDDLFSDRPNGKIIANDLALWLRRRQSGSRRPLMPTSEKYVQEVIAAFNRSFLEGVQIWREYPLYGNTDIKYDIREYLENIQNVNLMDYVQ